jgi:hypothetical protein
MDATLPSELRMRLPGFPQRHQSSESGQEAKGIGTVESREFKTI